VAERTTEEWVRVSARALRAVLPARAPWESEADSEVDDAVATTGFVAATAHWSAPTRFPFLARLVNGLVEQREPFSFAVYVNGPGRAEHVAMSLRRRFAEHESLSIQCAAVDDLARLVAPTDGNKIVLADWRGPGNPYRLTWRHKALFRELTFGTEAFTGLLLYLEDDIELSPGSLRYWRNYRPLLAPHGFIPGFLRVEGPADDRRVAGWSRSIVRSPGIMLPPMDTDGDEAPLSFVAISNPYQAMYILDASLARSHFAHSEFRGRFRSKFSRERGGKWGVPERAAVGALFDGVRPAGFVSRAVTPMQITADGIAIPYPPCLIDHVSENYYRDQKTPMSKQPVAEAFRVTASDSRSGS
jgi:hypothetical protein